KLARLRIELDVKIDSNQSRLAKRQANIGVGPSLGPMVDYGWIVASAVHATFDERRPLAARCNWKHVPVKAGIAQRMRPKVHGLPPGARRQLSSRWIEFEIAGVVIDDEGAHAANTALGRAHAFAADLVE